MSTTRKNTEYLDVVLNIMCHNDDDHQIGIAVLHAAPRPDAGHVEVGNGMRFRDDRATAYGDCPACAPAGTDQRIDLSRLRDRLDELEHQGRHAGKIQI